MPSPRRPGPILVAVLFYTAVFGPGIAAGDGALPAISDPVRVVAALQSFRVSSQSNGKSEAAWLNRLVSRLEREEGAHDPIRVVKRYVLERSVLGYSADEEDETRLQELASAAKVEFVVLGSLTRLADRYSLDVRLLRAERTTPMAHRVFEGEGVEGLARAFDRAAEAVRQWIAEPPVEPPPAAVSPVAAPVARPSVLGEAAGAADSPLQPVSAPKPFTVEPPEVPESAPRDEPGPEESAGPRVDPVAVALPRGQTRRTGAGAVVTDIRVVGNRRIEADAIRGRVVTRVGERYDPEIAREDVRRVFDLGFFRDVQVLASDRPEGKIVTFVVEENPIIRKVAVSGNTAISADDIREQLTLTVGSTIDYPLLLENRQRIEGLYQAKGYYLVSVNPAVEPLSDDAVIVSFDVVEGRKLRLVEINFVGNEYLSSGDLEGGLATKRWRWYSPVTHYVDNSGLYAEPVFFQDVDRIRRKYMDAGFIQVRIGEPEAEADEEGLKVTVRIQEGEQFRVGEIDVLGDATIDREQLRDLVEMSPGTIFNRSMLTEDVERLRRHYADRGFFFAQVEPMTRIDPATRTVDCSFKVEKGDLYFVDRIEVAGNTRTRDRVVRREMEVSEGSLFSSSSLERSRARVRRLGFFDEVSMEARPLDEPGRVAVDVEVVERPTGSFSFGAGFGSTDGFILNASVRQDNLFGRAYNLNANLDFGGDSHNFFLRFTNPYVMGSVMSLSVSGFSTKREFIDFNQEVKGFSLTFGYPLDEGETRGFGGYAYTQRSVTGESVQATSMVEREEFQEDTDTSLLTFSARRDTRDDPRFPRDGQVTGFALEFAGLGGLTEFIRAEARTTWFLPAKKWLGFDSTLVINSRAGWTIPMNDISDFDLPGCTSADCQTFASASTEIEPLTNIDTDLELPITERYFLGGVGAFQLRGFKQRSLGPRRTILNQTSGFSNPGDRTFFPTGFSLTDPSGCVDGNSKSCNSLNDTDIDDFDDLELTDVVGGNKFFLLNLELQFPISEEIGLMGIVFLDMGNAFSENESINPADFRFGTGAGVQWFSPFGPILLQLGFPLDPLEDEDGSVFEFSLGGSTY